MTPTRIVTAVVGGAGLLFFIACLGFALPGDVAINLIGGWIMFLVRVMSEIDVNIGGIVTGLVCLAALVVGMQLFLSWFYRATPLAEAQEPRPKRVWHWRWTFAIVTVVVLMFVAGISAVGVTHQTYWLATSPEPNVNGGMRVVVDRIRSQNDLRQIILAVHNYASNNQDHLPAAAISDKEGRPLLSWRVLLLPYLEQDALFRQFKLDEAWDSPHNIKLLPRMPRVYVARGLKTAQPYETVYRAFVGPGTLYPPGHDGKSIYTIANIPDGAANTIFVVEAAESVPWTKPDDFRYSRTRPLPRFQSRPGNICLAGMLDGSVHSVALGSVSEETLRHAIEANDEQILGPDW